MRINQTTIGAVTVCTVEESRVAADVSRGLKESLTAAFNSGEKLIVLDLSAVTFIDSSGLSALVSVLKTVTAGGDLVLCGVSGAVGTMFKLTRMDKVFRIFGTVEEAVAALS
jgi:anti-sigma B factor antagonist